MSTKIEFHNATPETFAAINGEIKAYNANDGIPAFCTKTIALQAADGNALYLTVFSNIPSVEPESGPTPEPESDALDVSLKAAIQKRLAQRAAERKAAAVAQAKKDAERSEREREGREYFIAELQAREGVTLPRSQVEVVEETTRAVYSIRVLLNNDSRSILFSGQMYYNNKKGFAFMSWEAGHGNWYVNNEYYPTLADAAIATLDLETALTDADINTLFD